MIAYARKTLKTAIGYSAAALSNALFFNQVNGPIKVAHETMTVPQWPARFQLRAVLIADMHIGAPFMDPHRVEKIVSTANDLNPDATFLLGDNVTETFFNYNPVPENVWAPILAGLKAPLGVFNVDGNHDWKYGIRKVRAAFEQHTHIRCLENEAVPLRANDQDFWVAGLGSQWGAKTYIDGKRLSHHDIDKTLMAITNDAPAILLMHEPDIFESLPDRFSLVFAGHTHGGQIKIGGRRGVGPVRKHYSDKMHGIIKSGNKQMLVSAGIGWSGFPLRIGVPPEINCVTIMGMQPG